MGTVIHHAVVVHVHESVLSRDLEQKVAEFRDSLERRWRSLVVGPVPTVVNFATTYALLPDGSKELWPESNDGDQVRAAFIDLFKGTGADLIEVRFGDPERSSQVRDYLMYEEG